MRLTWKLKPRLGFGYERSSSLRLDGREVAVVSFGKEGWYWWGPTNESLGIEWRNSAAEKDISIPPKKPRLIAKLPFSPP